MPCQVEMLGMSAGREKSKYSQRLCPILKKRFVPRLFAGRLPSRGLEGLLKGGAWSFQSSSAPCGLGFHSRFPGLK